MSDTDGPCYPDDIRSPMTASPPDPRRNAFRSDLADIRLKGRVEAERFVEGRPARVRDCLTPLMRAPRPDAPVDTQLLLGEPVLVFECPGEGWAWVQSQSDGYIGWCADEALDFAAPAPTHRVTALWVHIYPAPDIKIAPVSFAPMNAQLAVSSMQAAAAGGSAGGAAGNADRFAQLADGRFVVARHLAPLGAPAADDFVAVARRFLGTPYLWAGRSARGIDCSGLVQMGLAACGIDCPRDSDMQERELGMPVNEADPAAWQRGDLVFWKGHVGIVSAPGRLLHANAFHMQTAEEDLVPAIERIAAAGLTVTSVKRLSQ